MAKTTEVQQMEVGGFLYYQPLKGPPDLWHPYSLQMPKLQLTGVGWTAFYPGCSATGETSLAAVRSCLQVARVSIDQQLTLLASHEDEVHG